LGSHFDFSTEQINGITSQLEGAWKQCWVSKGSKIPSERNCSTFKVCQSRRATVDQLGEIQQLIKAGQDRNKHWFDEPSNAAGSKRASGDSTAG